ncbi:MAG: phospholipase D-like domain-containing protein, partial [Pyrinomonadaceae bacterium]
MSFPKRLALLFLAFILLPVVNAHAQERLCDTAFEDCRTPLWQLIDNETQGIDVAFWFMQDTSIANKLIARHNAGVPVRVLVDPRANPTYAGNENILNMLKNAGIPMRYKLRDGILHWKMMLFAGQGKVEFSGANYEGHFFVPFEPNVNYMDEAIYFTDDVSVIQSFKTKYDDVWTNTVDYGNFANINTPLTRRYPTFPINPELNLPPSQDWSQDYISRTQQRINAETQKIDVIMYRITNQAFSDMSIAAVKRGVPMRLIHEPDEYRNPARQWDSWNVDRMYMAGVQIKMRKHLGLNHQKSVLLYGQGMTIFGSSNWTGPSGNFQLEHNYFTTKAWFFDWFRNQFERKWNSPTENETFVPLPPQTPVNNAPLNNAVAQPTTLTLKWEGGQWAHKYDIYFGTTSNPPLLVSDASTFQSGAQAGQPLLETGSPDDGVMESYKIPVTLQPGTTYFWRVVGKTMANQTANGPTWSFTTAGTASAPTPTPTPGTESPNNTRVPPATQIVDSTGAVWTLSSGNVLRNGLSTGGNGSQILYCNQLIYVLGTDSNWWRWTGSGWTNTGSVDPCGATPTPTPTPTPSPTPTPAPGEIQDVVWTSLTNATATGNNIAHSGGGYFAKGQSQQTLSGPGYFEWRFDGEYSIVGLGNNN